MRMRESAIVEIEHVIGRVVSYTAAALMFAEDVVGSNLNRLRHTHLRLLNVSNQQSKDSIEKGFNTI